MLWSAALDGGLAIPVGDAPQHELLRSPAAARVGSLAAESGLLLYHFEHRAHLALPEAWCALGQEADAEPPEWQDGILPEPKYQSFRHDLLIGSYHPSHRAKWTTHELCHGLVGFAWKPGATPLFHATASRLAELVPVALWYFFDEVRLRRCALHAGHGALFRVFCADCEAAAAGGMLGPVAAGAEGQRRFEEGLRFVERELAAVARTRREGLPISHRWGSIDLCSDGLAYARSHGPRLMAPAFAAWAEAFLVRDGGWVSELDALEARVQAVTRAITHGEALPAWAPSAAHGRARWVVQDLSQRLLQVRAETEGEVGQALERLAFGLAEVVVASQDASVEIDGLFSAAVARVRAGYQGLYEDALLPTPESIFGVGYALPGGAGRAVGQVREGLGTVVPVTLELATDAGADLAAGFVAQDVWQRAPLGRRFAAWMAGAHPGAVAGLAAWEECLRRASADGLVAALGCAVDGAARLTEGTVALYAEVDVSSLAERAEEGSVEGYLEGGQLKLRPSPEAEPVGLLVGRDSVGELVIAEVELAVAEALAHAGAEGVVLEAEVREALSELGLIRPLRWAL